MPELREPLLHELCAGACCLDDVFVRVADRFVALGVKYCFVILRGDALASRSRAAWWSTYPTEWRRYYRQKHLFHVDPIVQTALRSNLPVVWSSTRNDGPAEFWAMAHRCGVRHGWSLALRGADGKVGLITLARPKRAIINAELSRKEPRLLWLAHAAMEAFAVVDRRLDPGPELTAREREILHWAVVGKTAGETGTILGISGRTVAFHFSEINRKLDVTNKTQAVGKAMAMNLLG